LDHQNNYVEH